VVDKAQKALSNKDKPPAQQEHAPLENIFNASNPGEAAKTALDAGKTIVNKAKSKISSQVAEPQTDAASKGIKERASQLKSHEEDATLVTSVKERAKQALDQVLDSAGSMAQKAEDRANQLKESAVDAGESIIQQAGERAGQAKKKLVDSFTNQSQRVKASGESMAQQTREQLDRAKNTGESVAAQVEQQIEQAKEKAGVDVGSITEQVKNKAAQIKGKAASVNEKEHNKDRPREAASSVDRQNFEELVEKIDTIEGLYKERGVQRK
jgi:hypothetical protein